MASNAELRQFLSEYFSDNELEELCFDHFPEVFDEFTDDMVKSQKAIVLIGYCERRDRMDDLLNALAQLRAEAFAREFGELSASQKSDYTEDRDTDQIILSNYEQGTVKTPPTGEKTTSGKPPYLILGAVVVAAVMFIGWRIIAVGESDRNEDPTQEVAQEQSPSISSRVEGDPAPTLAAATTPAARDAIQILIQGDNLRTLVLPGDVEVEQVFVPAGSFVMGSADGPEDERPLHEVSLDAYWIDRTEVTNAQFAACVADGACQLPSDLSSFSRRNYHLNADYADYSVIWVSWNDARDFCEWAGGRLPTEAEWEYAARGPENLTYPWGNSVPSGTLLNYNDEVRDTSEVGSYPNGASWIGALDMAGNVLEWVNDWYDGGYYANSPDENPGGPATGEYRVLRGGAWGSYHFVGDVRSTSRKHLPPDYSGLDLGFRCAQKDDKGEQSLGTDSEVETDPATTPAARDAIQILTQGDNLRTLVLPGDVEVEQVFVPAGSFMMGSADGPQDERPVHEVSLDPYWIDRTEVTNAQFAACVAAGACQPPPLLSSSSRAAYYGNAEYADYPVGFVSWNDARDFCAWAGGRLPTEAEWEYAARGPDNLTYPWGNGAPSSALLNYFYEVGDTSEAGSYPDGASWVGALDMAGNVWEWVNDWYDSRYYAVSSAENPAGPSTGEYRLMRGGAWINSPFSVRSAGRFYFRPDYRSTGIGFRCAQD